MDLKEVELLGADVGQHWYYAAKAQAMIRLIGGHAGNVILDVGAGSGFFSSSLLQHTNAKEAWCVDLSYPGDSDGLVAGKPIHFRRAGHAAAADLVLFMDVLEHVNHDLDFLRSYVSQMASGTRILITVPAFQFLWSDHDIFLGHKRRYRLGEVRRIVTAAGLRPLAGHYFFAGVFPIAAGLRLVNRFLGKDKARSQLMQHHPFTNAMLRQICRAELPLMSWNRIAGLTIFMLAVKP